MQMFIYRYYQVSDTWINWTSMIFMIIYIPLIFPASWFLDKMVSEKTASTVKKVIL